MENFIFCAVYCTLELFSKTQSNNKDISVKTIRFSFNIIIGWSLIFYYCKPLTNKHCLTSKKFQPTLTFVFYKKQGLLKQSSLKILINPVENFFRGATCLKLHSNTTTDCRIKYIDWIKDAIKIVEFFLKMIELEQKFQNNYKRYWKSFENLATKKYYSKR